jgi:hypothetical protein
MSDAESKGAPSRFPTEPIQFHYIKSNSFRVVHVDGAVGSITPTGLIHAAIYSERAPIPRMAAHVVDKEGRLGPPTEQDIRSGIVREVEVGLLLSRNSAEALRGWLDGQIEALDKAMQAAHSPSGEDKQ